MGDITGTTGNDLLFFSGSREQFSEMLVNPYSGYTVYVEEEKNVNSNTYEGLTGIDTLLLSNFGDVLIAESSDGSQMVASIESIIAGEGGDVIITASIDTQRAGL